MCDEIRLVRHDGDTPWGFRLTGGRDFGTPLLVVKVIGGSIAALAGVHVGDIVRGINYIPTNEFTHLDAQRAILESNDTLVLNLIRGEEEPEEIEKKVENLELSFVVKLNRSGRISAVEEILTPCATPLPPQSPSHAKSRSGSGDRSRSMSRGSRGSLGTQLQQQQQVQEEEEEPKTNKKGKVTLTVMDDGPIIMKPFSSQQVETKSSQNVMRENMTSNKEISDEVTLHEEMMLETSLKKTTTKITERSEEEFLNEVRGGIVQRARNENRELTEDEIMEMMAGEAEVLDEEKGTIGVNFQKFIPKCEFIKESSVFKALQEEQTKKEKTEVQQLMKDPTKRFSKFLIKPNAPKPLPKPKPVTAEPMPWQKKMENEKLEKKQASEKQTGIAEVRSPEGEKTFIHEKEKSAFQSTAVEKAEERHTVERREECVVRTIEQHQESIQMEETINGTSSSFSASKASAKSSKAFSITTNNQEKDDETETDKSTSNNRKDSEDSSVTSNNNSCKKRSSLSLQSEGGRSKTKKVGFMGVEERANIEKQLEEIQKELLTLQKLPLEIQNHLLSVQKSLQDIVSQRQSPISGMDRDEEEEEEDNDEDLEKYLEEADEQFEAMYEEEREENDVTVNEDQTYVDEDYTESRRRTEEEDEITQNADDGEESLMQDQEEQGLQRTEALERKEPVPKQLPHGQEDVEICRAEGKRSFPLTPQLRPLILPGGRKWRQPKDAFNEEFIAETIVSQSEVLVGTTIGVNFRKYVPPKFDATNSAVYRLIHELEGKSKKGVAERPEKVHDLDKYYNAPIDKRHFFAATLSGNQVGNLNNKTQP